MVLSRHVRFIPDEIIRVNSLPNHHFGIAVVVLRPESVPSHRLEGLREEDRVADVGAIIESHIPDGFETI